MPRQGDIAAMGIEPRRRQDMGSVNRHALGFVDCRGIAVVEAVVVLEVEGNVAPVVSLDGHRLRAGLIDGTERAVLYPKTAVILQEHHPVTTGKAAVAALDGQGDVLVFWWRLAV